MRRIVTLLLASTLLLTAHGDAAPKYRINGKLKTPGSADLVLLISKNGVRRAEVQSSSGTFKFTNLSAATLRNAQLYFFLDAAPIGPAVLRETSGFKFPALSGRAPTGKSNLRLTFEAQSGYLKPTKAPQSQWISKRKVANGSFTGASLGYPGAEGIESSAFRLAAEQNPDLNADSDQDSVPDILDIDDDNDGIPDDRDSGGGGVIASLYADYSNTLNAHLGNLNATSISQLFSSENVFGLTLFMGTSTFTGATGGHVVCESSQAICRSSADGGTTSFYTGVSESNNAIRGQRWSDYNADGSGKPNLEPIVFNGGNDTVLVGAIQPRSSSFQPGELITANVTGASGQVLGTRVFSILPPPISSPMLVSFDTGSGVTTINYNDSNAPGRNLGNAINVSGGTITLNFYPPQREAIPGVESDGEYRDIGNSKIGVLIGGSGITSEFTCAGLYQNLSSGITEIPASESMPGGAIASNQGAVLWPLVDSTPDTITTSGGLKSLTVNLSTCISRAGVSPGTYLVTLTYAGADT